MSATHPSIHPRSPAMPRFAGLAWPGRRTGIAVAVGLSAIGALAAGWLWPRGPDSTARRSRGS